VVNPTSVTSTAISGDTKLGDTGIDVKDANSVWVERAMPCDIDIEAQNAIFDGNDAGIKEFLARPVLVTSGTFTAADTATTFIVHLSSTLFSSIDFFKNKILGKYAIKYDTRIKLVVNADRFQAGRYILAGVPTGGDYESTQFPSFLTTHRHSLVQITQLPHVELDINSQTEVELVLPWVNRMSGAPIGELTHGTYHGDPWCYFLYPYSPLITTAGSSTATYSMFVSFENVKLGFPAVPQMAKDPISEEQKSAKIGPISSFLSRVSTTFNVLSEIPLLSTLASPTAWGADVLSRAANVWGWSSPSNLEPVTKMRADPFGYMASGDAANNANPMSLYSRNHVKILPGFSGTDADELSIDYLKSIPAWFRTFDWDTTDAAGVRLTSIYVDPNTVVNITEAGGTLYNYPPVSWVTQNFRYWRGSMTFTFKFVSTMFHSGRLLFVYTPVFFGGSHHTTDPTTTTAAYCYREIVDVRERKEVTVTVPYVNVEPWMALCQGRVGNLDVLVLDPLIAPATVSGTVPVLVEMSGGPDFELSCPIRVTDRRPTLAYTLQMDMPKADGVLSEGTIGGSRIVSDKLWNCEACIGEKVSSLRVLLKKYSYLHAGSANSGASAIYPFLVDMQSSGAVAIHAAEGKCDVYNFLAPAFLLVRGGMRIKAINSPSGNQSGYVYMDNLWTGTAIAASVDTQSYANSSRSPQHQVVEFSQSLSGSADFQCPMYHTTYAMSLVTKLVNVIDSKTASSTPLGAYRPFYVVNYDSDTNARVRVYRSVADDFNFGFFISTPPLAANI